MHPDEAAPCQDLWNASVRSGEPYRVEYRFRDRRTGGYRWFLGRAVAQRDEAGRVTKWFGTCTDIDAQRRQNEELEGMVRERTAALLAVNAELSRSNQELEDFAYVASHDLQEPLRKVRTFGDRLKSKFRDQLGEQGADYVERMQNSAARMQQLIEDLLAYSRVTSQAKPFGPTDLGTLIRDPLNVLEDRIARTGAKVEVGPLPTIYADPSQMRQLFQNLLGNALKFHKPDQTPAIRVSAESVPASDPANPDGRAWWRLLVADDGIGFDERYLDRIFQVFQRLHGRDGYEGTGVGLAICRKIVERHGGSITARSEPGRGATFVVLLPERPSPPPKRGADEGQAGDHPDGR